MLFDMPECGGCRTCELVCAQHHLGKFSSKGSSIRILNKEDKGEHYLVKFVDSDSKLDIACDGCKNLETPLCVQYCREAEKLEELLRNFLDTKVTTKKRNLK